MSVTPDQPDSPQVREPNVRPGALGFGLDRLLLVMAVFSAIAAGVAFWLPVFRVPRANPMGAVLYTMAAPSLLLLGVVLVQSLFRIANRWLR